MKNIQTHYNGYYFRSRTEARWAVFFDAMGIEYKYEQADFVLSTGRYLPDFFLPNINGGCHVEVKWKFTDDEIMKCFELSISTKKCVLMLDDVPEFKSYYFYSYNERSFQTCDKCFEPCQYIDNCEAVFSESSNYMAGVIGIKNLIKVEYQASYYKDDQLGEIYKKAIYAARSARFEFGESGKTR